MIDTVELTPAIVGLGNLHEPGFLALVADTHYRILTQNRSLTPRELSSTAGQPLYPSVVALHLHVPPERPLHTHVLWHRYDVTVDVHAFGRQFLEVTGAIGERDADPAAQPRVTWSALWTANHEPAMARSEYVAALPKLEKVPAGIAASRDVAARGSLWAEARSTQPILYPVVVGRDAAVGRQMMFSQFVVVLDTAERALLERHGWVSSMVDGLVTTERRIFYFSNCRGGDTIEIRAAAKLSRRGAWLVLRTEQELVDARTRTRLALADTEKLVAPGDADRLLARHGEEKPFAEVT